MKSFITVYPNTEVYRGPGFPGFYMIGYNGRIEINTQRFRNAAMDETIMSDLHEWDKVVSVPEDMLKLKIMDSKELALFLEGVKEVSDDRPYTEFPIWRKMNNPEYSVILDAGLVD